MSDIWIGFDLGGTKMLAVAYGPEDAAALPGSELGRRRRKTKGREGSDAGIERIGSTIDRLIDENDLSKHTIAGIGIGCPGPIDLDKGKLLMTPNLGWDNVDVRGYLGKKFNCPVAVINDVDAGVYGEYRFGAARGARCVVGLFPGTGIGGGCVYEGRILHGAGISCMEVGHMRINNTGRRSGIAMGGTLESEASRLAIAGEAAKAAMRGDAPTLLADVGTDIADIRSGALADAAKKDPAIAELIEQAAENIGYAVVNLIHLLSPDHIILGGGMVEAMEKPFLSTVTKIAEANVMAPYRNRFKIAAAALADDAGVLGAAAWAKHTVGARSPT